MNGYEIFNRALARLGYESEQSDVLAASSLEFINQILLDLKLGTIENLSSEMSLTPEQSDALTSGVAMLLALREADGEKNTIYTAIYNAKRSALLSKTDYISDVLPTTEGDV